MKLHNNTIANLEHEPGEVYVTVRPGSKVIQAEVLSVSDTSIRVRVMPLAHKRTVKEYRLPRGDLKACRPVSRVYVNKERIIPHSGYQQIRLEFFLSEEMARAYLDIGRDMGKIQGRIARSLSEATGDLEALFKVGGRLPMDSGIPEQVIRLQALIERQWEDVK